ncbi:MAG: sugar nucleotide-binding protein, partial [Pseudomonadota bacterium]
PTPAAALAAAAVDIARALLTAPEKAGTDHFAGREGASRAEFARAIFDVAGRDVAVEPIPTEAYPTPAPRPRDSRLDTTLIGEAFGIAAPDWRRGLAAILKEIDA